jgi:hypothetical protein
LLLSGIDELLTYHYLVAELFMVLPVEPIEDVVLTADDPPSPDIFYAWSKERQADLIFEELFVKRTPLSEACRGVITALGLLGQGDALRAAATATVAPGAPPRLSALRAWFAQQDVHAHLEHVFSTARLRYAVMTNIPFAPEEAEHWLASPQPPLSPRLKPALRVDPLLAGDWPAVRAALRRSSTPYDESLAGVRAYLTDWVVRTKPIYLMASTPHGFTYAPSRQSRKRPAAVLGGGDGGNGGGGGDGGDGGDGAANGAAGPPSATALLEDALLHVAAEHHLPVALKVGAVRGANPALRGGGDGVEVADLSFVRLLCVRFPHVKFLLTVLSTGNQHELAVLGRKFGNLHVYGCWWYAQPRQTRQPRASRAPATRQPRARRASHAPAAPQALNRACKRSTALAVPPPPTRLPRASRAPTAHAPAAPPRARCLCATSQPAGAVLCRPQVLQQPVDHLRDNADAARDARDGLHVPAQRRARARAAAVQVEALARRDRARARRAVHQAPRRRLGAQRGRCAPRRGTAVRRRV